MDVARRAVVKMDEANLYYYYYYYYCLGLPERAFHKRLTVFSLKTIITKVKSNILLVKENVTEQGQSPPKRVICKVCKYIKFANLESRVHRNTCS